MQNSCIFCFNKISQFSFYAKILTENCRRCTGQNPKSRFRYRNHHRLSRKGTQNPVGIGQRHHQSQGKERPDPAFFQMHTIVTLIDPKDQSYTPFLLDSAFSPIKGQHDYQKLTETHFSLDEPFIQAVLNAEGPVPSYSKTSWMRPKALISSRSITKAASGKS